MKNYNEVFLLKRKLDDSSRRACLDNCYSFGLIDLLQMELPKSQKIFFSCNIGLGHLAYILYAEYRLLRELLPFFVPNYQPFSTIPQQNQTWLPERTCREESYLYGGVIFIHKVVLDELDSERTLAHASSSHHHQLVLRHVCNWNSPRTHRFWRERREQRNVQVSRVTDIQRALTTLG